MFLLQMDYMFLLDMEFLLLLPVDNIDLLDMSRQDDKVLQLLQQFPQQYCI